MHSLSALFTVHLTATLGQWKNKIVTNRQKVLSWRRKLNVIQVWLLASWVLRALFINMAWLLLSQTWMPYDLLPSWVINLVHTDMRALIWAACHQVLSRQCHIMLQSLSAVAWSSLCCSANPPPPQKKSMQLSNSWTHECKLQVLIYLCPRWFHPLAITLPTNHCSQEMEANGIETSIVAQSSYYFRLVVVWWSTPSL